MMYLVFRIESRISEANAYMKFRANPSHGTDLVNAHASLDMVNLVPV